MRSTKKAATIPKKVKIGYSTFKIDSRSEDWKVKNKAVGLCSVEHALIEYYKDQNPEEVANTIIHELLHAIIYIFDIEFDSVKKEECLVKKMANGLQTTFSDNPQLMRWLVDACKSKK